MKKAQKQKREPRADEPVLDTDDGLCDLSEQKDHRKSPGDEIQQPQSVGRPDNRDA